ncbi:MAG: thiamine pyrophosphate-dependent enzyme [Anaerovoracaceae bacterium]|jgi:2-oxoglutarate ferredoxin oxidoreductase subunit beta
MHIFDKYMRIDKLPQMWCRGCGNGIVLQSMIRAIDNAELDQDKVVIVSGIGCSSRANGYTDFCGIHTNHGRPIAYATGVKMANPDLDVIVVTGDGDCTSIGGNHFIHACRRNLDLTVVVFNNNNYGMTGGQYSPTTPVGSATKTSPFGNVEPDFDVCKLAEGSGATYVARATTYHVNQLIKYIENGIRHRGMSVIDAMCDCPTLYGRMNGLGSGADMIAAWPEKTVTIQQARGMSEEELEKKTVIGEFVNTNKRGEYTEMYQAIIERAQNERAERK